MLSSVAHQASEHLAGINIVHFDPIHPVEPLVKALKAAYAFDICEPMPARWHMGLPLRLEPTRLESTGPDPLANRQWGLRAIRWFDSPMPDASKVTVAVLDTGIDITHPDLAINDVDYHHTGLSPTDIIGHGTHVSGIIAARSRNATGIAGIADCKLAVWKIFTDEPDSDGEFYVDGERYLQALREVTSSGARVMNLSIGGRASSRTENLLFQKAIAGGCTVVAAMGNEFEEGNPTEYPGAYQDVLAVGAVDESLRRAPFSNTGMHIGLVAPGAHILSTLPMQPNAHREETAYAAWSGTSMATPHVAAAAALVAAKYPNKTAIQVRDQLLRNTTRLRGMGVHKKTAAYGSGLLYLREALLAA